MTEDHMPYWLAALYLPDVGPRTMMRWLELFPDIKQLFLATDDELQAAGIALKHRQALQNPNWKWVEKDLAWAQLTEQHLLCLADENYPCQLKEISDPPLVLFVRGDKTVLAHTQIAMVGARNATPSGLRNAEQFAYSLSAAGLVITSGLALGIDAASHRGALGAKGITIAVLGTGLNDIYPRSHRLLAQEISAKQGAVISEFPLATPPHAHNFPRRNRIIAGLSLGVLVVEAALKSGSLITARHAVEHGRDVFAVPGSIHHPLARGCHHLIRQGAKLVETADDIIEELLPYKTPLQKMPNTFSNNLIPEHEQLLAQIDYEITPIDAILLRSGLTASRVSSILLKLELDGYIQSIPGGYVRIIANQ